MSPKASEVAAQQSFHCETWERISRILPQELWHTNEVYLPHSSFFTLLRFSFPSSFFLLFVLTARESVSREEFRHRPKSKKLVSRNHISCRRSLESEKLTCHLFKKEEKCMQALSICLRGQRKAEASDTHNHSSFSYRPRTCLSLRLD